MQETRYAEMWIYSEVRFMNILWNRSTSYNHYKAVR